MTSKKDLSERDIIKRVSKWSNNRCHKYLHIEKTPFPSPPLAEQQAIVARVDSLMATIGALEAQVTERKEQAQQLMQAVLREAFAGGENVSI